MTDEELERIGREVVNVLIDYINDFHITKSESFFKVIMGDSSKKKKRTTSDLIKMVTVELSDQLQERLFGFAQHLIESVEDPTEKINKKDLH